MAGVIAMNYLDKLNEAFGATSEANNIFGKYVERLVKKGVLSLTYRTDCEVSYEFADGSSLELYNIDGSGHMGWKGYISNGISAGEEFFTLDLGIMQI